MRADARSLGIFSGGGIVLLSLAYAVVTVAGLSTLEVPSDPIGDPWFSAMEALILLIAPLLIGLMLATHRMAPLPVRWATRTSLASMALAVGITVSVHLPILMLGHDPLAGVGTRPFQWPSTAYLLDIAAWDGFVAISVLFAAGAFGGDGLSKAVRLLLIASGLLAFAGLAGPIFDMRLRAIGILGYAVVFPIAAALMTLAFLRRPAS